MSTTNSIPLDTNVDLIYIEDITDFINKLEEIKQVHNMAELMDTKSLYTNIPPNNGISIIGKIPWKW